MIRPASQTAHDDACEFLRAMTHREPFYQTQTSPSNVPLEKEGFLSIETRPDESGDEENFEKSELDREKLCRWVCEGKNILLRGTTTVSHKKIMARMHDTHMSFLSRTSPSSNANI
eukprot:scaffold18052_cov175-Amphora_coffeaeformis.AAC.2